MSLFVRNQPWFTGAAALTVATILFLLAWSAVDEVRFSSQRIGVEIAPHERGIEVTSMTRGLPAEEAGVKAGDILIGIGSYDRLDFANFDEAISKRPPGSALRVSALRNGQAIDLELTPGTAPDMVRLLTQLILVGAYLGLGLLAARYQHQDPRARLLMIFVTLIAIEMALPTGYTFPIWMVHGIVLFWLMTTGLQIALELHLVSLIPVRLRVLERKPWLVALYYGIGLAAGLGLCVLAIEQWLNSDRAVSPALAFAEDAVLVGWALSIAAILVWQVVRATGSRGRNQALLVLLGLLPWTLHILASTFWGGWQELDSRWTEHAQNFALLLFPATIFIAIFRYGLFDVENLVRRSLVYGAVATLVLLFLYILLTAALPVISDATGDEVALWLVTAMALVIGILFRPIRDGLERLVEKGLFPERRALRQRLIEIAGSLSDQDDMKELVQRLADDTRQALRLDWASVVAVDGPERKLHAAFSEGIRTARHEELVALLNTTSPAFANLSRHKRPVILRRLVKSQPEATRKLRSLGAEVLIPLYFQRRMIGILCLSSKQNGELFLREELELLDLFSHQIATNFENLRLFQDATYEGLTGLLRREAVLHQLDLECRQALERSGPISVFMIDLDHFKLVNDTYGHLFGDIILKKVAAAMKENVRAADALGRYGGEEFLLVLPDTDYPGALKAAEKLRKAIADLRFDALDGEISVQVTISIGAACSSDSATEAKILVRQLLEIADLAVYKAKNEGRNRIVVKSTTGMVIETEPGQATSG